MRIALACPYAWDAAGGVQVQVRGLATHLAARGHETLVLAPAWRDTAERGVRIVGRPIRIRFNGSVAPIAPDPRSIRAIRGALADFEPDVVHVHEPMTPSTGMFATLAARSPVVGTFHAYVERSVAVAAFSPLLRNVVRRLRVRLAVSDAARTYAERHVGDGFRIVPNAVDIERFDGAEPAELPAGRRILFVGRLEPRKGFRFAVSAFARLTDDFPDLLLVVAGDGDERAALDELAPAVRRRVVMLGMVPNADLPPYHASADVFVAPNTGGESFGIVLVEAMAAGVPVVATDIPGYREVVRAGVDGLLVPPRDAASLAAALRDVLTDERLARRLSDAGRERAQRFRWDVVTDQVEEAYRTAVGG